MSVNYRLRCGRRGTPVSLDVLLDKLAKNIAPTGIAGELSSSFLLPDDIVKLLKCLLTDLETGRGHTGKLPSKDYKYHPSYQETNTAIKESYNLARCQERERMAQPSINISDKLLSEVDDRRESTTSRSQWIREAITGRIEAEDAGEWSGPDLTDLKEQLAD